MAGHVALVGEAGGQCGGGEALARLDAAPREIEPAQDEVAVGRDAEGAPEMPRDGIAVEAVLPFEGGQVDAAASGAFHQLFANAVDCGGMARRVHSTRTVRRVVQGVRDLRDRIGVPQGVRRVVRVGKGGDDGGLQARMPETASATKGSDRPPAAAPTRSGAI